MTRDEGDFQIADVARARRRRRTRTDDPDCQPCRRCTHYGCQMDRGDPLPPHIRAYQDGEPYHDTQTRTRVRGEAVQIVDGRHGYSIEFAADAAAHEQEWRAEEVRLLTAWDAARRARYLQEIP